MIMNKLNCLFALVLMLNSAHAQDKPVWNATIKVIDESGQPVANADALMEWNVNAPNGAVTFDKTEGLTDVNGIFKASHAANGSIGLGFQASKAGYYSTKAGHEIAPLKDSDPAKWNHNVTLMLKKIVNPIPMYAKFITYIKFPVFNKPIGYDLTAGDWVAPYGKGVTSDFLFTESHTNAHSDYFIIVDFPNKEDGIQEFDVPAMLQDAKMGQSDLRSSQEAPVDGYQPEFIQPQDLNLNRNYYFRVRTVLDSQGNILSTHYGKIYGDFMQFRYYLNPTPNDRNVEFDPKHNLLGGLQSYEQVKAP